MKQKTFFIVLLISISLSSFGQWQTYPYTPNNLISFPADDGEHTTLNTKTEWWYINLHLIGSAPAYKKYDVMLCYFARPTNMRIFNIATPEPGIFHTDVNKTPMVFNQQVGKWDLTYKIPFGLSDYSTTTFPTDGRTYSYTFHAESPNNNDQLDVNVVSNRIPLIVGGDGYIPIGGKGDSSYYYSYSNMKTVGTIKFAGITDTISSGLAWIDRQWGPFTVGINTSNMYEWFSLQMDKPGTTLGIPQTPSEYNIWQIFSDSTNVPFNPAYRLVSALMPDNTQDTTTNFIFERTGYWYDQANNKYYSQGWRLINPAKGTNIDMSATIKNQVIDVLLFKFWEGSTTLKGTVENQPVDGLGFAELVAGHNSLINLPTVPTNLTAVLNNDHYTVSWNASTNGTYPVGGYRIYRSRTNDGYWNYIATTTELTYDDYSASRDSGYFYTVTSFDNQTHTSGSAYANAIWIDASSASAHQLSEFEKTIKIYPNPSNNIVSIEVVDYKNSTIELSNIQGQTLKLINVISEKTKLDISNLANGVYIVKISNSLSSSINKLIKN
ncbi:MAG: lipocalin-like domain-containing protein [Bacteroidota bacterium]